MTALIASAFPSLFASAAGAATNATDMPLVAEDLINITHWVLFGVFVFIMLVLDLTVFHKHAHEPSMRESFGWTVFWCGLAATFNILVGFWLGWGPAGAFLVGYVVEWSLSMDNVFVWLVVFNFFAVPLKYQYRVLFWGILGAIVMRLTFVTVAATLIANFSWVMWLFGALLVYSAIKLATSHDKEVHPENNPVLKLAKRMFRVSKESHGDKFFVKENGLRCITPLFLVLLVVETTDVIFAVDSVPAIFGAVSGWGMRPGSEIYTFIVFTSNVFAILGLRALYFLLAGVMGMFRYLPIGLSAVLGFVGLKMIADYWVPIALGWPHDPDHPHHLVPPLVSLFVIFGLLGASIVASIIAAKRDPNHGKTELPHSHPPAHGGEGPTAQDISTDHNPHPPKE